MGDRSPDLKALALSPRSCMAPPDLPAHGEEHGLLDEFLLQELGIWGAVVGVGEQVQ